MDGTSSTPRSSWPVALVIALLACAGVIVLIKSLHHDPEPTSAATHVDLARLKASTTDARFPSAPRDDHAALAPSGTVIHPRRTVPLYDGPAGTPFAKIQPHQFDGQTDTWLPVVAHSGKWLEVLLPSRPNGSTGWVQGAKVDQAHTPYQIQVHLASRTMDLFDDGEQVGSWPVAVGAPGTPTPTGRTFLLSQLIDDHESYSPVILPLGAHSDTLDTFGGGPGTVALHGWTDPSVFGHAVSHGCVRVPSDALDKLRTMPLGTAVLITAN